MPVPPHAADRSRQPPTSPPRRPTGLLALGSAAVLAVYAAGFVRTRDAAAAALARSAPRTRPVPAPALAGTVDVGPEAASPAPRVLERATPDVAADAPPSIQAVTPTAPPSPASTPTVSAPTASMVATATPPVVADTQRTTTPVDTAPAAAAAISQCLTRYSCSWIAHLQAQVAARQSPEVDNVSGATESANAFYYAVVDALKKAR
jgi:hypothetical protein